MAIYALWWASWRKGYPFGRTPSTWSQDLFCDFGVCAEDKQGGLAKSCTSSQDCESSGLACAKAQDGVNRCMGQAVIENSDDCYQARSYDAISLKSCPSGSFCEKPGPSATKTDFQFGFCFEKDLISKGQPCNAFGGGKKCKNYAFPTIPTNWFSIIAVGGP